MTGFCVIMFECGATAASSSIGLMCECEAYAACMTGSPSAVLSYNRAATIHTQYSELKHMLCDI